MDRSKVVAGLLCALFACREPTPHRPVPDPADTIIVAGTILADPRGDALAIRGTRIMAVSTEERVLRLRGPRTRVIRLPGAVVLPGLVDAHGHLVGLGAAGLDLRRVPSFEQLVAKVAEEARTRRPGSWILGRGWDQNLWPDPRMPTHEALSRAVPEHPVFLRRVDGHAALCNRLALELAGIDRASADPEGGRIVRDARGEPTGVLIDRAMELVASRIPKTGEQAVVDRLLAAQRECLAAGLTRVHEMGVSPRVHRVLRRLEREGRWRLGVYGALAAPSGADALPPVDDPGPRARLRFRAVKMYADGALGSRGAALLADYADEPGNRGLLTTPIERLRAQIGWCRDRGYQPCVHAIGDRANRIVLDLYEELLTPEQRSELRPRIEHAQVVAPDDLPRFARLGVIASMQPTHLTTDMRWAPRRLGPERIQGAYAFRTLLDGGARVCFGSDFPVEPVSPFEGLFAAITTRPPAEPEHRPYREDQQLAPETALRLFTEAPAFASFEEGVRGRIAVGYEADLTIVDRDPTRVPPKALLATRVLMTVIGGEIAWRAAPQEGR